MGSHAQYEREVSGRKYKVTVDEGEREFDDFLLRSMVHQSGLTRDQFYCGSKTAAKKINKRIGDK